MGGMGRKGKQELSSLFETSCRGWGGNNRTENFSPNVLIFCWLFVASGNEHPLLEASPRLHDVLNLPPPLRESSWTRHAELGGTGSGGEKMPAWGSLPNQVSSLSCFNSACHLI